jgi:hypothetical protein
MVEPDHATEMAEASEMSAVLSQRAANNVSSAKMLNNGR